MIVGVPTEIKRNENRVALTPGGAYEFAQHGHEVLVQAGAGEGSGFEDEEYRSAGARIAADAGEVFAAAGMILKVKEPIASEYALARRGQLLFTYFHFASSRALTEAMVASGATCIAYETVELPDRSLPLLVPMSEVAGRMSVQEGAKYLEKPVRGRGVLLGGVPGVPPGKVVILGGGVVGMQAAKMASGLGAQVVILDVDLNRMRFLNEVLPANVVTLYSNAYNIREQIRDADLVVGAVLIPGARAPKLIRREMLAEMRPGTVLVDVAVDQGGCIETCTPTTHDDPTFIIDDVVHYCVANMPGAVPYTSTLALTNATLPYAIRLAHGGWRAACRADPALAKGVNVVDGQVTYEGVAEAFDLTYTPIETVLAEAPAA